MLTGSAVQKVAGISDRNLACHKTDLASFVFACHKVVLSSFYYLDEVIAFTG